MSDIVSRMPFALSGRSGVSSANYVRSRDAFDFSLGGVPLLSKIDDQHPYSRGLAPIRKDQFDNQQIPGEQSLSGWWLRSESTFIGGQGLLFQDPVQSRFGNEYGIRYGSGYGVNPWVDGKLTLLKRTSVQKTAASAAVLVQGYTDSGTDYYWHANSTTLTRIDAAGANTAVTWGGAAAIQTMTNSGNKYYVASTEGIYRGTNAAAGTKLWNNTDGTTVYTTFLLGYAKQRLMLAANNKIFELGADPAAPPVNLPVAKYAHPNANFTWVGFAEGTTSIYAAGHDNYRGFIYKFVLDASGTVPTLSSGVLAATLPDGETVLSIYTYLGTYVGLGTSRGFRVGQIDTNGDLQYGPLLFEISGGVNCITGYDRFMWCGATNSVNGKSGLYRVDLGMPLQISGGSPAIRHAYATDLSTLTTGTVTSVTSIGALNQRVIGVTAAGSYLEHATELEATGVMTTGRVRFNTIENKLFKFLSIRTPDPVGGALNVATIDKAGTAVNMISYGGTAPGGNDVAIAAPQGPQEYISLQFTLSRGGVDLTKGAELNAWQLKAVPGVIRQRLIQMSFLMNDYEEDRTGQKTGYAGRTADRLRSLESMIQPGDALQFQDLIQNTSDLVFVEQMEFKQMASPGKGYPNAPYGGILTLQMRTVADNVLVS